MPLLYQRWKAAGKASSKRMIVVSAYISHWEPTESAAQEQQQVIAKFHPSSMWLGVGVLKAAWKEHIWVQHRCCPSPTQPQGKSLTTHPCWVRPCPTDSGWGRQAGSPKRYAPHLRWWHDTVDQGGATRWWETSELQALPGNMVRHYTAPLYRLHTKRVCTFFW